MKKEPSNGKILIADDELINVHYLEELLSLQGYEVLTAANGFECLDILKKEQNIDLILLDIMMPEMDGYEVCKAIKAQKRLSNIPVIFLTALEDDSAQVKALKGGGSDYITKPIKREVLEARIHNHLKLKRINDELEKSRKFDKMLLDSIPHPAMIINQKREIIVANKTAHDLGATSHGYCWEEFMKTEYLGKQDKVKAKKGCKIGIKCTFCMADEAINKQTMMIKPDIKCFGKIWDIYWKYIGEDEAGGSMFLHYAVDITDRKRMEQALKQYQVHLEEKVLERTEKFEKAKIEAEAANKAKSDFLSSITHELTTPLNGILGFAGLIKLQSPDGQLSEKQKTYLDRIEESGKHLLGLVDDILDIAMIEAGKLKLNITECNLNKLLQKSLALIQNKAFSKKIKLNPELGNEINAKIDQMKIKQVLFNLLANAIKFTPEGGKITITLKKAENKFVLISIEDTGVGIEHEKRDSVFNRFEQADTGITRKFGGIGLGMPLAKRLVELHNGKIWFESEGKDRGTCFFVMLPLEQ